MVSQQSDFLESAPRNSLSYRWCIPGDFYEIVQD